MYCYECGGAYQKKSDYLEYNDPVVGTIVIRRVPYFQCDKCDDILFTEKISRSIEAERNKRLKELVNRFPISDFMSATETAQLLGISRQALHKNRRINHGFIHQTTFGGVTVYLRQSVRQFKKTGDGRFPLYIREYSPSAKYIEGTIPLQLTPTYDVQSKSTESNKSLFQRPYINIEENCYAN